MKWIAVPNGRLVASAFLLAILAVARVQAQPVKIAGIGAATCRRFNEDVAHSPNAERDYVAWAQGLMSGILLRAPSGRDEDLDLLPPSCPLQKQADFLRGFFGQNPDRNYMEGLLDLYRLPRGASS